MKRVNKYILALILLISFSCDNKLDLEPAQSLSTDVAIEDYAGLLAAISGAYDGLQSTNYYGRNYIVFPEVRSDNVYVSISNSNRFISDYNYQLSASVTQGGFWNQAYSVILRVNNILAKAGGVSDAAQEDIDQIIGEAYAIRAMVHFDLVRIFAKPYAEGGGSQLGVPIKLNGEITEPPRNTVAEVYTQVIQDLTEAKTYLNDDGLGPYRFTTAAADALLARVYLYQGDNANAESSATTVIGNAAFALEDDLSVLWTTHGTDEEIFTVRRRAEETLGSDNLGNIFNPLGYGDIRVTQDIRDMYEPGDERISLFYDQLGEYYVGKYPGEEGQLGLVNTKVLRLAEMYLIRAEARAKQSKFTEALSDIDVIRDRSELGTIGAVSNSQVLAEVLDEKRREFAFEGHRSFDLFRNGMPLQRIQCNTGIEVSITNCEVAEDSYLRIYPIPRAEMDVNQNMVQNDGY